MTAPNSSDSSHPQPTWSQPAPWFPPPVWMPPGWTPPAPQSRRRLSVAAIVTIAGVLGAIVFSGLGLTAGVVLGLRTTIAASPTPAAVAPRVPTTAATAPADGVTGRSPAHIAAGDAAALTQRLVPPSGVETFTPDHTVHGVYTAAQLSLTTYNVPAAEKAFLTLVGFRTAVANDWMSAGGVETLTQLIQFKDATGAIDEVRRESAAIATDTTYLSIVALPMTKGSRAVGFSAQDPFFDGDGLRRDILQYQDGPVVIAMTFFTGGQLDWTAELKQLQQQINALAH